MEIEKKDDKPQEHEQHEPVGCSTGGIVTFALGLVAGTFSALLCKMAYDTTATGLNGEDKAFAKPIMMLLLMFAGMVPALFFWLIQQAMREPKDREVVSMATMTILVVPSLCDLLCTLLLLVAQLYITASLWQMMRGSIIIITALMKRLALNHRLKKHMWLGVTIITVAMLLVASTSFLGGDEAASANPTGKDPRIGILLVVVGCLAQGVQYVFEEKVMAVDNAPPLVVIGFEGLWGTVLTLLVVYPLAYLAPGADNGSFEDPYDAWYMISQNSSLSKLAILFVITVTCYNCMAVYVTKYLSAIWHAILDNFRPITIWVLDLAIFYVIYPGEGFGEQWTSASYLQLAGLLVLFFGTAVYNGSVYTFDDTSAYQPIAAEETGDEAYVHVPLIRTDSSMASSTLMRSPLVYHPQPYHPDADEPKEGTREVRSASGSYQRYHDV